MSRSSCFDSASRSEASFDNTHVDNTYVDSARFDAIATEVYLHGFSVQANALPLALAKKLHARMTSLPPEAFERAGIGRHESHQHNQAVRSDRIRWLDSADVSVDGEWLKWAEQLQQALNRRLFLGLFSFESHFAHYRAGDFYRRHIDAFKGQASRTVSLVVYLNRDWDEACGGELVLYRDREDQKGIQVVPSFAKVVVFLSEEFPHEVLPATRDRYSIAGWFRVNTSDSGRIDPPS
ncbi:2OG-Fe(II) oxygenase [Marinagarivorans algicola]|uniref:2OG-Fe(II) oxygenase n=1 Tax=Marinagarivorans algicola TaxID=1513270 RepID=UPI0006B4E00B|nr:2OG-Fe(II) oxygenase [Marinagarivorans algicola]